MNINLHQSSKYSLVITHFKLPYQLGELHTQTCIITTSLYSG